MIGDLGSKVVGCSKGKFSLVVSRGRNWLMELGLRPWVMLDRSDVALRLFLCWDATPTRMWLARQEP